MITSNGCLRILDRRPCLPPPTLLLLQKSGPKSGQLHQSRTWLDTRRTVSVTSLAATDHRPCRLTDLKNKRRNSRSNTLSFFRAASAMTVVRGSKANPGAPGVPFYTPAQNPPAGTPLDPSSAPTLFQPITSRGVTLHNRFVVSPMCMYSADNGHLTDFHLVHLGQYALAGAGLVMVEATAVEARGRISPEDSGIWADSHIPPLKRVVDFIHSQGSKAAIQLAHAGRKASTLAMWVSGVQKKNTADESANGWPSEVVGPSAIPYDTDFPPVKELSTQEVKDLVVKFAEGAKRAVDAGFDVIEIHGAHGYLHTEFLSPLTNKRTDEYGGSFENRTRFLRETIAAVRAVISDKMPLWLRISATEWMEWNNEPSWTLEESIALAKIVPGLGIDVLDVSSGGNNPKQSIELHNGYQVDLGAKIRQAIKKENLVLQIAAVGQITEAEMARSIVQEGKPGTTNGDGIEVEASDGTIAKADYVLAARQFLRDPQWVLKTAHELNVSVRWPNQYSRAKPKLNRL